MKQQTHFFSIGDGLAMVLIFFLAYSMHILGKTTVGQDGNMDTSLFEDSSYISDCEQIYEYNRGIEPLGTKRLILSLSTRYYYEEVCEKTDNILSVINVSYLEEYKGFEVYWINQSDPSEFSLNENITDIECMGNFVVIYSIKNCSIVNYEAIQQMGFNDSTDYLKNQELSWFIFIDSIATRSILFKNAFTEYECKKKFDDSIKDISDKGTVVYNFFSNNEQSCF